MNQPKVSIIILNWNGLEDTINCLESLKKITYKNYEIIVVDNGSEGNDADVLEERYKGHTRLIRNKENLGFGEGNNVALRRVIKEGKSNYILLLNNDTLVTEKFLEELVKVAESSERIGICGAKLLKMDNPKIIDSAGHVLEGMGIVDRGDGELDKGQYDCKIDVMGASAAAALYRRKIFEDIGLFKEEFAGYDDAEFSWRAWKKNWKSIFVPSAIVYHRRSTYTFKHKDPEIALKFKNLLDRSSFRAIIYYASRIKKIQLIFFILIEICVNLVKILANAKDKKERKKIVLFKLQLLKYLWKKILIKDL